MIISRTPKTGRKKEGLQVTGSIANSSCCCCPTSGTRDNIPYWATDIDKRHSDQAYTEFDLEGPTQQLLVFFCLNSPVSFVQHVIRPWYVPLLILRVHFYRQERAQWWFPKALMCALGKRSLVHYVQRARKVGWGGVQLIRWEGGGWAADNSMAISQAGSVQLIDPPNCIPHCLTVSLPHILSCTSPIKSSWHHNSAP